MRGSICDCLASPGASFIDILNPRESGSGTSRTRWLVLAAAAFLALHANAFAAAKAPPPVTFDQPDDPNLAPIKGEEQLKKSLQRTPVFYRSSLPAGSIIIDSSERYLYFIQGQGRALRYGVAVGRDGYGWEGAMKVTKKVEWPDWKPPRDMIAREKKKGKVLPAVVQGGPKNPLGARALYLGYSEYRIHGTNRRNRSDRRPPRAASACSTNT